MKAIERIEKEIAYVQVELRRKPSASLREQEQELRRRKRTLWEIKNAALHAAHQRKRKETK